MCSMYLYSFLMENCLITYARGFSLSSLFHCVCVSVYFMSVLLCSNYYSSEEFETWKPDASNCFLIKIALSNQALLWLWVKLGIGLF